MRTLILGMLAASGLLAGGSRPDSVTFYRDVLPVLQARCQECHRPGEIAPMAFLSYKETRPWAKAIKEAVLTRKMPPWFADPGYGHFTNERKLTDAEVHTLTAWAESGAPEGDPKDRPAPASFAGGWRIGKPDLVVQFPHEIQIPATGTVDQSNLLVRVNFPNDIWVKAAEVRPGNRRVVHHMKAWVRPPGASWMKDAPEGELFKPTRGSFGEAVTADAGGAEPGRPQPVQDMLAKYNPGVNAQEFTVGGAAKFIPAGSDIVFECHYTTTGKPETDRSSVGIVLASEPPEERYVTVTGISNTKFVIPPRAAHHEVMGETIIQNPVQLVWVQPHMHLRAKDYELRALYPTGESEILLKVPVYDFNWQLGYEFAKPLPLPKGTRLESIAHYDNSANNPYNPNPDIEVRYGPQTTDEMNVSFMGFLIDRRADPAKLLPHVGGRSAAPQVE